MSGKTAGITLEDLPPELRKEAMDFVEYLLMKHKSAKSKGKFSFDWEGGLSGIKDKYSSVELQHKASDWR